MCDSGSYLLVAITNKAKSRSLNPTRVWRTRARSLAPLRLAELCPQGVRPRSGAHCQGLLLPRRASHPDRERSGRPRVPRRAPGASLPPTSQSPTRGSTARAWREAPASRRSGDRAAAASRRDTAWRGDLGPAEARLAVGTGTHGEGPFTEKAAGNLVQGVPFQNGVVFLFLHNCQEKWLYGITYRAHSAPLYAFLKNWVILNISNWPTCNIRNTLEKH